MTQEKPPLWVQRYRLTTSQVNEAFYCPVHSLKIWTGRTGVAWKGGSFSPFSCYVGKIWREKRHQIFPLTFLLIFIYVWMSWVFTAAWGLYLLAEAGLTLAAGAWLLTAVASLCCRAWALGECSRNHALSCPVVCRIFPDQLSNPCLPALIGGLCWLNYQGNQYSHFKRTKKLWIFLDQQNHQLELRCLWLIPGVPAWNITISGKE